MRLLIITGISGAGKSLVVKYLEDIGFFCVKSSSIAYTQIC